jgi:hypothetical protein
VWARGTRWCRRDGALPGGEGAGPRRAARDDGLASRKAHEDPMSRTKSKLKTATRSEPMKTAEPRSSKRPVPVGVASGAVVKTRTGTKHAQVVPMLQDWAGNDNRCHDGCNWWATTSCARLHSEEARSRPGVRTERKRFRLFIDGTASSAKADRVKQAA